MIHLGAVLRVFLTSSVASAITLVLVLVSLILEDSLKQTVQPRAHCRSLKTHRNYLLTTHMGVSQN